MFLISRSSLFLLLLALTQPVLASDSVSNMLSESIYLLELLVIAIVAVALVMVTASITKSRHKVIKAVADIREEMGQERAMLQMTMDTIKEKEKQITYMAHLLQEHLENNGHHEVESENNKKKVSEELFVEVIDDVDSQQADDMSNVAKPLNAQKVDPRTISADGSVKQTHFGPDQYLASVESYQQKTSQYLQDLIKQTNQSLSSCLAEIHDAIDGVRSERGKLSDFIAGIESSISPGGTHRINTKDKRLIQSLVDADKQLQLLEKQQQAIEKYYSIAMLRVEGYVALDNREEVVEIIDSAVA
jgi:type II secretory pathway pseudopilin PulG